MYSKRIKIFVIICSALLAICLLRLIQMQIWSKSDYRQKIAELKLQRSHIQPLKTIRGRILDRKARVIASDEPAIELNIDYTLSSFADMRVQRAELLKAAQNDNADLAIAKTKEQIQAKLEKLQQIIDKCVQFGADRKPIESKINFINDRIWYIRSFLAWRRNNADSQILNKYNNITDIPLSVAMADFEKKFPDEDERILLTAEVTHIADMDKTVSLVELKNDDDVFAAQVEFLDVNGVTISPKLRRHYPYGSVAAQTVGWVGPAQRDDQKLFENDRLARYLEGEVSGKEDGAEYVCENILRGKRGEIIYDIDSNLATRTEIQPGSNVTLTIDIELQKKIEEHLANFQLNETGKTPIAAVVIDVFSADILALVSLPCFDLNRVRYNYGDLARAPNEPLLNRALNALYPPGSVVKPIILIAGIESGNIKPYETISCPAQKAPKGWPSCWYYNRFNLGHDNLWSNTGRNAIKGSCNIYFSKLADRIDSKVLQQWLFKFGYGQKIALAPVGVQQAVTDRDFRQAQGQISQNFSPQIITGFDQVPPLNPDEKRWFGIGQGNLRVTPLQEANAMAAIARGGLYKKPRLFIEQNTDSNDNPTSLGISQQTLETIRDGMYAVVNESGGTAYNQFAYAGFEEEGVKVFGKTGSTEGTVTAWFAGFAQDNTGRSIALVVIVEGGKHGSSDAGPLARSIIRFCIEEGYIGQK